MSVISCGETGRSVLTCNADRDDEKESSDPANRNA